MEEVRAFAALAYSIFIFFVGLAVLFIQSDLSKIRRRSEAELDKRAREE